MSGAAIGEIARNAGITISGGVKIAGGYVVAGSATGRGGLTSQDITQTLPAAGVFGLQDTVSLVLHQVSGATTALVKVIWAALR